MRALEFITVHVIYNLSYTYKFQLKTTLIQKIDQNHRSELKYQTTCGAEFLLVFLHNFDKNFLQTFFLSGHVRQLSFWTCDTSSTKVLKGGSMSCKSLCGTVGLKAFARPFSMTQLLLHTFSHLTGPSFRVKAKLLPNKFFLGLV